MERDVPEGDGCNHPNGFVISVLRNSPGGVVRLRAHCPDCLKKWGKIFADSELGDGVIFIFRPVSDDPVGEGNPYPFSEKGEIAWAGREEGREMREMSESEQDREARIALLEAELAELKAQRRVIPVCRHLRLSPFGDGWRCEHCGRYFAELPEGVVDAGP